MDEKKWSGLKVECAGRRVRLDAQGNVFYEEDDVLIKQGKAAWWPEGKFRIVAVGAHGGLKQWLLFFELREGDESYFEGLECSEDLERFQYPDFLLGINRRLEVIPICGAEKSDRMCCDFCSSVQMDSRFGKRCFAEIVHYVDEVQPSISRMAYFDADTNEFVLVDCLNERIQRRPLKAFADKMCYRYDSLAYDAGDYYVAMKIGEVNRCNEGEVMLKDAFGAHNFERFTKAFYECGNLKESPFYDIYVPEG